jgi:hypothetical protein
MEHTSQVDHLPKLELSNPDGGDVVVCTSFRNEEPILPELEPERISFVAPLTSRCDLEWLLRGLHLYPNIRHVILCGDDAKASAEALLALWKEGLDEDGRIAGSRGLLSQDLESASIDELRGDIQLLDMRDKPLSDISGAIRELPVLAPERDPRIVSNPAIPERKVFLSRKTSFPIFSSSVADSWLQLLNLALRIGIDRESGKGRRAEALNAVVTIEVPVLEDGEREERDDFPEYLDFSREDFERLYLPRYGQRFHEWKGIDQLATVCDRLKRSPDAQAAAMVFVDPTELASDVAQELTSASFQVVDGELFASFVLQSSDVYTDWPLEASALVRLQREMAEGLGLGIGTATFIIHAAYLREGDFDRSLRVLDASFKRPLPLHVDPSGVFLFGNDGGKARAMLLNHDASDILWEDAFSDPEDLSWYIVDVMPWLLPQHIRYVGQECAALMRAMREKECYLQG